MFIVATATSHDQSTMEASCLLRMFRMGLKMSEGSTGVHGDRTRYGRPGIALAIMLGAQLMIIRDRIVESLSCH
jgi:hypothetical protein